MILVLAERAAIIRGRGGIFNLARSGDVVSLGYWTGWLLAFGYFCLAALYAWGAGQVLSTGLLDYLGLEVDYRLLAALAVVFVALLRLIRRESAWNLKSGWQIVPGVSVPIGVGPSKGEYGGFLYLSFEK